MRPDDLQEANDLLAGLGHVDAMVSKRLGLHVVSRLAHRYGIHVVLTSTAGLGITAVVLLPPDLFAPGQLARPERISSGFIPAAEKVPERPRLYSHLEFEPEPPVRELQIQVANLDSPAQEWDGWWTSEDGQLAVRALPSSTPVVPVDPITPAVPVTSVKPATAQAPMVAAGSTRLRQRTPQAHLAPELQRGARADTAAGTPREEPTSTPAHTNAPEAVRAREALSRYQASRRAALAEHDTDERDRS
jgi:hypothetical protein